MKLSPNPSARYYKTLLPNHLSSLPMSLSPTYLGDVDKWLPVLLGWPQTTYKPQTSGLVRPFTACFLSQRASFPPNHVNLHVWTHLQRNPPAPAKRGLEMLAKPRDGNLSVRSLSWVFNKGWEASIRFGITTWQPRGLLSQEGKLT